jgi:NAD(P)-dependent dehydrogenase (short-subunit alcohol dehydrogenase family)
MEIQGKAAVVSGGASGLGEATVRALVARGAKVVIADMNRERGEALAKELGSAVQFIATDVSNAEQVKAAIEQAAQLAELRAVVNCAGIAVATRVLDKAGEPHPLASFEKTISVNLIGTFNMLRLGAAQMAKNPADQDNHRGVIINTASVAAFDGQIGQAAYSASKGGVVGMTLPVARDLAKVGIRVCTICPGTLDTPMLAALPEPARVALASAIPFPSRLGLPREFAALALHIVDNNYLNGETIRLDGALRMAPK